MIDFIILIVFLFALGMIVFVFFLFDKFILRPFKFYFLGKRLYKYTKIPSHGSLIEKYKWCKNDKEAIEHYQWYEFVEVVYPAKLKKRIKPKPTL